MKKKNTMVAISNSQMLGGKIKPPYSKGSHICGNLLLYIAIKSRKREYATE